MSQHWTSSELINKHFFFIDSTDEVLKDVKTHLYGYLIDDDAKVIDGKLEPDFDFDEDKFYSGSYVYVRRTGNEIALIQDYIGSYGLFLFRHGDYFALSNSFVLLVDQIKTRFPLTLNEDYTRMSLVPEAMTFITLGGTFFNEIELISRACKIFIDAASKSLELVPIKYGEYTIPIDSPEAMTVLDNWVKKWSKIAISLNGNISADLTGGFDSRATFMLLICSGIDLNQIEVISRDNMYTPGPAMQGALEDWAIASEITKFYGCSLNKEVVPIRKEPLTVEEIINIYFYVKLGFHEVFSDMSAHFAEPSYHFNGHGGPNLKGYAYKVPPQGLFGQLRSNLARDYKSAQFESSIMRVTKTLVDRIVSAPHFLETKMPLNFMRIYAETRNRIHYGGTLVDSYLGNRFEMAPLLDWEIARIRTFPEYDPDMMLLYVVLFDRYQKDLLKFRLSEGHSFDPEAIKLAEELNAKYPLDPNLIHPRKQAVIASLEQNKRRDVPADSPLRKAKERLVQMARTQEFKTTFTDRFPDEIYFKALRKADSETKVMTTRLYKLNPVIAATKFLVDERISRYMSSNSLEKYFSPIVPADGKLKMRSLKNVTLFDLFRTARIELIKTNAPKPEDFVVVPPEGNMLYSLVGLGTNRVGYMFYNTTQNARLKLQGKANGEVTLMLRSKQVVGRKNENIPIELDYTYLAVNGQVIFADRIITADFAKPSVISFPIKQNEVYDLEIRWQVHGYSDDELLTLCGELMRDGLLYRN